MSIISQEENLNFNKIIYITAITFVLGYLSASLLFYPSVLINGRIWAEEAREFLIPLASTERAIDVLFYLHRGHLDLFPNIATLLSLVLPFKYIPHIYVLVSLIPICIFSICYGYIVYISTGHFRQAKDRYYLYIWVACTGFLASCSNTGIESHLNTINSWTFIVASVALLIPITQSSKAPTKASIFICISPLIAFPCILFSPLILIQFFWTDSKKIKIQNLIFIFCCAIQLILPYMLPSDWAFANHRCFGVRDIISIIPIIFIRNLSTLIGNIHSFEPLNETFLSSYINLFILTLFSLVFLTICMFIYMKSNKANDLYLRHRDFPESSTILNILIGFLLPISFWQIFAYASSLSGAYGQLMMGGGYRYSYSFYLVFLTLMTTIFSYSFVGNHFYLNEERKETSHEVSKFQRPRLPICKMATFSWMTLMIVMALSFQAKIHNGDDWWCFMSRPEWQYRNRSEFLEYVNKPELIKTCPRGWTNKMQRQKRRSQSEMRRFCNYIY